MGSKPFRHLRVVVPVTLFCLVFLVVGSMLQKMAIGVPLTPRGFVMPAFSGITLGALLGIWMARDRVKYRLIRERSRQIEVLNAEVLRRETELQRLLDDKELLLAEVHHRVRNILQLLSSIVSLEVSLCDDQSPDPERITGGFLRRIESIATVYDQLIDPKRSLDIRLSDMVPALASRYGLQYQSEQARLDLTIDHCTIPISQSIPLALVLDEVFVGISTDGDSHSSSLRITVDTTYCHVRYRRDDTPASDTGDCPCRQVLRVGLFRALAAQLNGTIDYVANDVRLNALDLSFPLIGTVTVDPG